MRHWNLCGCAVVALGLTACQSTSADLAPAKSAKHVVSLEKAARADQQNITVIAQAKDWPGDALITAAVTPMRVTITNKGDKPLRLRYADFELAGTSGRTYRALPPYRIDATVPKLTGNVDILQQPAFEHDGFEVAAPYDAAYPTIRSYPGPFDYDPWYYDNYYGYWDTERLPTPEMLGLALPEGVLQPGGYVSGYLYFEKVEDEEPRVQFQAALRNADREQPVARISMPFVTD